MIDYFAGKFDAHFLGVVIRGRSRAQVVGFRYQDVDSKYPVESLMQLGNDAFITDLSRRTVVVHETRHFHDALLFPLGAIAFRQRLMAARNGLTAMGLVRGDATGAAIPVPLEKWLYLSPEARAAWLRRTVPVRVAEAVPDLPVLDVDDDMSDVPRQQLIDDDRAVLTGLRSAMYGYRVVRDLWRSPHLPGEEATYRSQVFWEASATLCQFAMVRRLGDDACLERFQRHMLTQAPAAYSSGLTAVAAILGLLTPEAQLRDQPDVRHGLALVTWAQMGGYATDMSGSSSPLRRLEKVAAAVIAGLRWDREAPFAELASIWDGAAGADWLVDLHDSTRRIHREAEKVEALVDDDADGPGLSRTAAEAMQLFANAHDVMRDAFLADPDKYVDPWRYVDASADYPAPAVATVHPGKADGVEIEVWEDATPTQSRPIITFDRAMSSTALILAADALFMEYTTTGPNGALGVVRRHFRATPVMIFDLPQAAPSRSL